MIRVGVVGLGKMGLSHLSILGAHPQVTIVGVADASGYLVDVLSKYTGIRGFSSLEEMLVEVDLDALLVATPSRLHGPMVKAAIGKGIHVFCEKPLTLSPDVSRELAELAYTHGVVTQVGYHNRFVAPFQEMHRLLNGGAIGRVTHVLAEAYGPVVLKSKGATWRAQKSEGGGALYDYAAHPLDLLSWYVGEPIRAGGSVLGRVFSESTDDEVYSTLFYENGTSAQLSVNWSDESYRKMTTRITATGTQGRIFADRQEVQAFFRSGAPMAKGYREGWNVRYTTDLTDPVAFYLRGEEYSAQIDCFIDRVRRGEVAGTNDFSSAAVTDRVMDLISTDAAGKGVPASTSGSERPRARRLLSSRKSK
ncbi:Gfo/Idh/MocA family oxidoreductase [Glaciibacter flavus]|uniref:Gfo/Idh/MocA family oxidoreductase n=1 Tax=Orlajensenia flava TaxID=2565934 RepID=A0A4S4FJG3_9MICO|nr:Gfo/Idh/MocA family oxidoreductase [Glaciibacter flavus]THG30553.1 Gfo/Idh/MocA family oxidoreductase [Glaciibacter flavus]